ncbi:MAG: glycogen debranching protein [Lentimicrobiaceae bacterium]|nr:glycogen debranching protein [Lentimicrobiaceae bacterium]
MIKKGLFVLCCLLSINVFAQKPEIYQAPGFAIFNNRVEQASFKAVALSDTFMVSDYISPANRGYSADVQFKFSLNSRDNEMISGSDHLVTLQPVDGCCTTGPLVFGQRFVDTIYPSVSLPENTKWTIKLDMRRVLGDFEKEGFYTLFNGQRFYKDDFKGVYIAGGSAPLSWDFENLYTVPAYELKDPDGDGIFETTLLLNPHLDEAELKEWRLTSDVSEFPRYKSTQVLADALYNLSLEEMLKDIRTDGAFMAGKEWDGVWTRDISYSIQLSLALLKPETARISLMRKVKNKRIIQDTGSGGSWPVSTDRMVWAVAAWEIYKVTGDRNWLEESFEIIQNSWEDDRITAFDKASGLYFGESSFLDWREQTYPKWMEPVHIFQSFNLGTNVIHYQTCSILAEMADILGKPDLKYKEAAIQLSEAINKNLWMADKGYYAQYIYGGFYKMQSPRSESLGEALCILSGIAEPDKAIAMTSSVPVTNFGIPCIYPQIPMIKPYHNDAVWPFVQAYWALASAKAGNEESLLHSIAAIYRQAGLFLTNKENFVATNGDYKGTAINSDRQLWSVAANLALVYKVYFGMDFQPDGLYFNPFIPENLAGKKELSGFCYRNAVLDIVISGHGRKVKSFCLDGVKSDKAFVRASLSGKHMIEIVLGQAEVITHQVNQLAVNYSLPAPVFKVEGDTLEIEAVEGAQSYIVYRNGNTWLKNAEKRVILPPGDFYTEYTVACMDSIGNLSFAAKPVSRVAGSRKILIEAENFAMSSELPYKGFSGNGFVELSNRINQLFDFDAEIPEAGEYLIYCRYSNGSGPVNTDNKCAIRTLAIDGENAGTLVMPQRGKDEWSNWGDSNFIKLQLSGGKHRFSIELLMPQNQNMNGEINTAMLDAVSIIRVK